MSSIDKGLEESAAQLQHILKPPFDTIVWGDSNEQKMERSYDRIVNWLISAVDAVLANTEKYKGTKAGE